MVIATVNYEYKGLQWLAETVQTLPPPDEKRP